MKDMELKIQQNPVFQICIRKSDKQWPLKVSIFKSENDQKMVIQNCLKNIYKYEKITEDTSIES